MKKKYMTPSSNIIHLQMEQPILSASISVDKETEIDASGSYSEHKESIWGENRSRCGNPTFSLINLKHSITRKAASQSVQPCFFCPVMKFHE